ncbi:helix-turn-helix transcriptional regulator [Pseudolysinimonas sp.]|uniref:helix-turn-helix transcriptional regulator n=1 Tax=Pseudolysinimonas sp. TaxID=2680009 RepID=UPI00286B96DC|nr:helix-turn-helix transcriptional regulator [Pseudolysinimonas sp.]
MDAALAAGDAGAAVAAVRPVARAVAVEHGAKFRALIADLPESAWHADAEIASAMGASYRAAGSPRGSSAIGYFRAAEAGFAAAGPAADPDRVAVWLGRAAALRTLGRLTSAQGFVQRARDLDGPGSVLSLSVQVELGARCMLESGLLNIHLGNLDDARSQLEYANGLATEHLTLAERIEGLGGLAIVEYVQAGIDAASRHSAEARALAAGTTLAQTGFVAPAILAQTLIAIDRHDLDDAAGIESELLEAAKHTDWEPFAHTAAGYQRLAGRRLAEGLECLQRARHGYRTWSPAGLGLSVAELMRASLLMHLDQGEEAWAILRDLPAYEHHILCPARVVAQLRLRHGDLRGAAEALDGCEQIAADHSQRTMVDVRMLRAAIEFERANHQLSDVMFDRALIAMACSGSRAPLRLIPPGTLAGLAARALTRGHNAEATGILNRIAEATEGHARLIEPLSHRELLVLAEVENGSTVASIATTLFVSPNTVKTHLRRLYRKLGVTTRADAIRKAKSLGLGRPVTRDSPE